MNELLDLRKTARVLKMTQKEVLYNVDLGRIPVLRLQRKNGKESYRFSMRMIEEAMKAGTLAEESVLKGYTPGRLCNAR